MVTFKITITNWEKHNGTKKKNHRYFMLEYRFFEDEKISQLKQIEALLFLKCLCIAADLMSNRCVVHAGLMPRRWRVNDRLMENCLKSLQSFQLLSYEKNESFKTIKEKKTKEKTLQDITRQQKNSLRVEKKINSENFEFNENQQSLAIAPPPAENIGQVLYGKYCTLWKQRYNTSPPTKPQDAKNLKNFGLANGVEKTISMLETYFVMPDSFFLQRRHDIQTFLYNVNSIVAFQTSGKVLTKREANQLDSMVTTNNTLSALREGKI